MSERNILITDDDSFMRRLIQFTLQKSGHRLDLARTGEEAVQRATAVAPDLVIMDVTLPGIDGFEALRQIKAATKRTRLPVIMLTARGQHEVRDTAGELGVNLFLTKPFSPVELAQRVAELLAPPTPTPAAGGS